LQESRRHPPAKGAGDGQAS
jgi:integrase